MYFPRMDTVCLYVATSQRFAQSIREARKVGATVKIYLHSSDPGSTAILNLKTRLGVGDTDDRVRIFGYQHSPTFRAIIVGDLAIGIQPYMSADPGIPASSRHDTKLPLCLIITRRLGIDLPISRRNQPVYAPSMTGMLDCALLRPPPRPESRGVLCNCTYSQVVGNF